MWADEHGRNRAGLVLIQEQQIFAARDVQKGDARPGGYVATGGHGGILGGAWHSAASRCSTTCRRRGTPIAPRSTSRGCPGEVMGVRRDDGGRLVEVAVPIKDAGGRLLDSAIPKVSIVKDGNYCADDFDVGSRARSTCSL